MTITVKNLQFSYKNKPVLRDVNFSAHTGTCICLLGENGAGKTTLFKCLLGLFHDYSGDILIDDTNSKKLSTRQLARKIAYIPQAHAPMFNYSVFETVLMGTNVLTGGFRTPGSKEHKVAHEALERLNITHLAQRGYVEISDGERQLTLIARALAQKSRILVMDEPTASLDYGNQFLLMQEIKRLTKEGYLILLSTHNPEHALRYADMTLVLKDGAAIAYGAAEEVLTPEMMKRIYGISVLQQSIRTSQGHIPVFLPYI